MIYEYQSDWKPSHTLCVIMPVFIPKKSRSMVSIDFINVMSKNIQSCTGTEIGKSYLK